MRVVPILTILVAFGAVCALAMDGGEKPPDKPAPKPTKLPKDSITADIDAIEATVEAAAEAMRQAALDKNNAEELAKCLATLAKRKEQAGAAANNTSGAANNTSGAANNTSGAANNTSGAAKGADGLETDSDVEILDEARPPASDPPTLYRFNPNNPKPPKPGTYPAISDKDFAKLGRAFEKGKRKFHPTPTQREFHEQARGDHPLTITLKDWKPYYNWFGAKREMNDKISSTLWRGYDRHPNDREMYDQRDKKGIVYTNDTYNGPRFENFQFDVLSIFSPWSLTTELSNTRMLIPHNCLTAATHGIMMHEYLSAQSNFGEIPIPVWIRALTYYLPEDYDEDGNKTLNHMCMADTVFVFIDMRYTTLEEDESGNLVPFVRAMFDIRNPHIWFKLDMNRIASLNPSLFVYDGITVDVEGIQREAFEREMGRDYNTTTYTDLVKQTQKHLKKFETIDKVKRKNAELDPTNETDKLLIESNTALITTLEQAIRGQNQQVTVEDLMKFFEAYNSAELKISEGFKQMSQAPAKRIVARNMTEVPLALVMQQQGTDPRLMQTFNQLGRMIHNTMLQIIDLFDTHVGLANQIPDLPELLRMLNGEFNYVVSDIPDDDTNLMILERAARALRQFIGRMNQAFGRMMAAVRQIFVEYEDNMIRLDGQTTVYTHAEWNELVLKLNQDIFRLESQLNPEENQDRASKKNNSSQQGKKKETLKKTTKDKKPAAAARLPEPEAHELRSPSPEPEREPSPVPATSRTGRQLKAIYQNLGEKEMEKKVASRQGSVVPTGDRGRSRSRSAGPSGGRGCREGSTSTAVEHGLRFGGHKAQHTARHNKRKEDDKLDQGGETDKEDSDPEDLGPVKKRGKGGSKKKK